MTPEAPEKNVEPYWYQEETLPTDPEYAYGTDARFIAMLGGTGGGKTFWGPRWLADRIARDVEAGDGDGAQYIVVGRTYTMAMNVLLPELEKCFEGTYLEGKWRASKSTYVLPTGGTIYFLSADEPYRLEGLHARGI